MHDLLCRGGFGVTADEHVTERQTPSIIGFAELTKATVIPKKNKNKKRTTTTTTILRGKLPQVWLLQITIEVLPKIAANLEEKWRDIEMSVTVIDLGNEIWCFTRNCHPRSGIPMKRISKFT